MPLSSASQPSLAYGIVLQKAYRRRRPFRDLVSAFALFLAALAANIAILVGLVGPAGTGMRGFVTSVALGAFAAAGLVVASDRD